MQSTDYLADPTLHNERRNDSGSLLDSLRAFSLTSGIIALLLLSLVPLIYNGYIAQSDEGVYSAQARALSNGNWTSGRPAADVRLPEDLLLTVFDPLKPTQITANNRIPYGRHPLFSHILSVFYSIGGKRGILAVSTVGGIVASIIIGLICRAIRPGFGIPGLLLASLSTPLLFNSYVVSGHSWGVALSAGTILGILWTLQDSRKLVALIAPLCAALLPMVRSEGSIFVGAMAITLAVFGTYWILRDRAYGIRLWLMGLSIGGAGVVGFLVDVYWTRTILDSIDSKYADPTHAILGEHTSIIKGVWVALLQPWQTLPTAPAIISFTGLLILCSAILWRCLPSRPSVPVLLLVFAAMSAIVAIFTVQSLVAGLIAAWPIAVFGIIWLRRCDLTTMPVGLLAVGTILGMLGLALTIYGDGGATQWGGRFLQVLLPLLIPLTVLGLSNAVERLSDGHERLVPISIIATLIIAISYGGLSLRMNHQLRENVKAMVTEISALVEVVRSQMTEGPVRTLTIYSPVPFTGTSRAFWENDEDLGMISVPVPLIEEVLRGVEFGDSQVVIVTDAPSQAFALKLGKIAMSLDINIRPLPPLQHVPVDSYLVTGN